MVPDRQKVRTDGMDGRTDDAKTISLRLRRGIIKLNTGAKEIQQVNPGRPDKMPKHQAPTISSIDKSEPS